MICGSRNITDTHWVYNMIDSYIRDLGLNKSDLIIVEGCARGVDTIAQHWAYANKCEVEEHPADWDVYGKAAGFIRNEAMVKCSDYCLILWDGSSKGTKHDIDLCEKYNLPHKVVIKSK